jgi:hypothetical protein
LTIDDGCELLVGNILKGFRSTNIAGICVDQEERLDFGYTGYDSAHSYEFAQMNTTDVTDGHGNI